MAGKIIPALLVTANVGSIFEDPSVMLRIWMEEFLQTVTRLDPKFIALHCQEVGGKNYERSMKHVEHFVKLLMSSEELRLFDKVHIFLDEDFSSAENFTALGNFYFVHESLADALIWDFAASNFVPATGKEVHSGNIEAVTTKEKAKFPQDFFPECKWSRKGFLRTRWSLSGTVFDLINIHLFHDASNFVAMESFPSTYVKNRQRALEHTLNRFHTDSYGTAPFFIFGDFNFRTDTMGVVGKLSEGMNATRVQGQKADHTKIQYIDDTDQVVLSLGKKEFNHRNHQSIFSGENGKWLKEFDRELDSFTDCLVEFPIAFGPSYPYEEDENGAESYMKTRCPSWCDRILLSNTATSLVNNFVEQSDIEYSIMGPTTCMGDHKPVYLGLQLRPGAGTVACCVASRGCLNALSRLPQLDTLTLPRVPQAHDDPYTPESMDTPSPLPSPLPFAVRDSHRAFNDSVSARLQEQFVQSPFRFRRSEDPVNGMVELDRLLNDENKVGTWSFDSPTVLVTQHAQLDNNRDVESTLYNHSDKVVGEMIEPSSVSAETIRNNLTLNHSDAPSSLTIDGKCPTDPVVNRKLSQSAMQMQGPGNGSEDNDDLDSPGLRSNRCFSDASWLRRYAENKPLSRVRLISGSNSLTRITSHHSSSDEDWFEEVVESDLTQSLIVPDPELSRSSNLTTDAYEQAYSIPGPSEKVIEVISPPADLHSSLCFGIVGRGGSEEGSGFLDGSNSKESMEVVNLYTKGSDLLSSNSQDCGESSVVLDTLPEVAEKEVEVAVETRDKPDEEETSKTCVKCGRCEIV